MKCFARCSFVAIFAVGLSSCAFTGTQDPVSRNLSWFDYLNAGDIRASCKAGAPDRYRFVYNGSYTEQVRTYDLEVENGNTSATLKSRVFGSTNLARLSLSDPLAPWQGHTNQVGLGEQDVTRLLSSLHVAAAFESSPVGLRLDSDGFYWIAAACEDGTFRFDAYKWPSKRFKGIQFASLLFAWDQAPEAVNPPREIFFPNDRDRTHFTLEVGTNGLVGLDPLVPRS